jgi:hypothetical protein
MKNGILIVAIALMPTLVLAHGDHPAPIAQCASKECTKKEIELAIPTALEKLTSAGKIESGWKSAKVEKVEQKQFKKGPEWVATLLDSNQKDTTKQRLYIFITTKGSLNGANFSGN